MGLQELNSDLGRPKGSFPDTRSKSENSWAKQAFGFAYLV